MRITGGSVFDLRKGFVARDVCMTGGQLTSDSRDGRFFDAAGCYVIPGLTDLHFHGCMGQDLSDGSEEGLAAMAEYELSRGVTQICPAGMTVPVNQLTQICRTAAAHLRTGKPGAELCGIHLEGPFLSPEKKGAQNGAWLQLPDLTLLEQLLETSDGLVKLVSVAPELPGAMAFIREASKRVTISLAHTTASFDIAAQALEQGAKQVTHLFNAMPPFHHRDPGVVGAALDNANCRVELICDGVHIHPAVVRAVFRMFGSERVILISDSMRATGMPDGQYTLGGQDVTVRGRYATLADGTLAGSVTDLLGCMQTAVSFGIPLADAVRAAAVNPAQVLGIFDRVGSLDMGKDANLVILNPDMTLRTVFFHGEAVQQACAAEPGFESAGAV